MRHLPPVSYLLKRFLKMEKTTILMSQFLQPGQIFQTRMQVVLRPLHRHHHDPDEFQPIGGTMRLVDMDVQCPIRVDLRALQVAQALLMRLLLQPKGFSNP